MREFENFDFSDGKLVMGKEQLDVLNVLNVLFVEIQIWSCSVAIFNFYLPKIRNLESALIKKN